MITKSADSARIILSDYDSGPRSGVALLDLGPELSIGCNISGADQLNGVIEKGALKFYPRTLTDTEIQEELSR